MATKKTNAPAAPPAADTVQVRALDPIRHDGKDYAPGEEFPVTPRVADALVAGGGAEFVELDLPVLDPA